MKTTFATLKSNYYSSNELQGNYVSGADLYAEMGIDHDDLIRQNPAYVNTCAARVSLALLKSNVPFAGRLRIRKGPYEGRLIETGAKLLADQLAKPGVFGRPELLPPASAPSRLNGKKGVILFWKIAGYGGGHIDLIEPSTTGQVCNSGCYFQAQEIWFWPLQ
ncbi:T6SS effector amidase Tae4 family protein [Thauera butanivorans]|uniref:T6SS effector amidase Tae4 family protein n=2 Tax=Thauera butanivorans TaxID=86174 RepID=UPI0008393CC2|nr:T6SS effector amidase Tae4 family protein [Thauera butanivorans]